MFMRNRRLRWPRIDVHGSRSRGDIKVISVPELERLTQVATENPRFSANGRPQWLKEQGANIRSAMLTVAGSEGRSTFRCLVMAVLADKSKCSFTLDVSVEDFDRLPDLPLEDVVVLAHRYLVGFPPLELDPEQKEAWSRLRRGTDG